MEGTFTFYKKTQFEPKGEPLKGHWYKRLNRSRTNCTLLSSLSLDIYFHILSYLNMFSSSASQNSSQLFNCECSACQLSIPDGYTFIKKRTYNDHQKRDALKKLKTEGSYHIIQRGNYLECLPFLST